MGRFIKGKQETSKNKSKNDNNNLGLLKNKTKINNK